MRRTTMDDIASTMGVSRSGVPVRPQQGRRLPPARRTLHDQALARARRAAADTGATYPDRVRGVLAAKLDLVLELSGDSPHTAELLDNKARLSGGICTAFTDALRRLLTDLFTETGTAAGVEPEQAADICIALVIALEQAVDARELLPRASDALMAGLLDTPVATTARA
ncbi:TetR/AcrR family transcriptional regulator [Streptomyces sp. NPDC005151]